MKIITIPIELIKDDLDMDILEDCGHDPLCNGDCAPVIMHMSHNHDRLELVDGFHRMRGMLLAEENLITVRIVQDEDYPEDISEDEWFDELSEKE